MSIWTRYTSCWFYVFSLMLRRLLMTHVDDLIMQRVFYARSTYFIMLMKLWTQLLLWRSNRNDVQSIRIQIKYVIPLILALQNCIIMNFLCTLIFNKICWLYQFWKLCITWRCIFSTNDIQNDYSFLTLLRYTWHLINNS